MSGEKTWEQRLDEARTSKEPFIGHPLLPIPLLEKSARTERVSAYLELSLVRFLEQYQVRGGFRGLSEVLRRLVIIGATKEGYQFQGSLDERDGVSP